MKKKENSNKSSNNQILFLHNTKLYDDEISDRHQKERGRLKTIKTSHLEVSIGATTCESLGLSAKSSKYINIKKTLQTFKNSLNRNHNKSKNLKQSLEKSLSENEECNLDSNLSNLIKKTNFENLSEDILQILNEIYNFNLYKHCFELDEHNIDEKHFLLTYKKNVSFTVN